LTERKQQYDADRLKLLKSLNSFINSHMGPMLAAEDFGGPVVSAMMDIDTNDLAIGFNAHGKLRAHKQLPDEDARQRRIDDIWGDQQAQQQRGKQEGNEATAAGTELRTLIEQLLNNLVDSGGESSASYITISRESAAARFLVRAKVAQFHPRDSTKLRLVDFGRDLDD